MTCTLKITVEVSIEAHEPLKNWRLANSKSSYLPLRKRQQVFLHEVPSFCWHTILCPLHNGGQQIGNNCMFSLKWHNINYKADFFYSRTSKFCHCWNLKLGGFQFPSIFITITSCTMSAKTSNSLWKSGILRSPETKLGISTECQLFNEIQDYFHFAGRQYWLFHSRWYHFTSLETESGYKELGFTQSLVQFWNIWIWACFKRKNACHSNWVPT
jgi:hypothetical protein